MNILLFSSVCLIWGTTWLAIKMQLGVVPVIWSVIYRFSLAAIVFFIFCLIKRYPLRYSKKQHGLLLVLGLLLFCTNYLLFYLGSMYLISGLVAVIAASVTFLNILNCRLFLKTNLNYQIVLGSLIGLFGLIVIFYTHLFAVNENPVWTTLFGFVVCLIASYVASLGNVLAAYNNRTAKIPVIAINAYGMLYGCMFMLLYALVSKQPPVIELTTKYIGSLLFLALPGTALAFQIYLLLNQKMGPERVGYVFVITPIIALLISSCYENFVWSYSIVIGAILVLIGNGLVLYQKRVANEDLLLERSTQI